MVELHVPFVLASGSPRRKDILETMGIPFTVDVSDVDESFVGGPQEAVLELSRRKAHAVTARHPDAYVLAADTLVYAQNVLGKPGTKDNAIKMLRELSGRWHSVFTGMTLVHPRTHTILQRVCETRVHFVELSDADIESYVDTGEPLDKAGAYGIQALGGMYIDRIEGSYSNAVGLSMSELREMIHEMNERISTGEQSWR